MGEWQRFRLGNVASVFDGPHATPIKPENGPWYLNIASLQAGRLRLEESAHISEEDFPRWTRRIEPVPGDVLFSYETRLGEAAMMPEGIEACLGRRMALLRPNRGVVDPRFLLYAYLGPDFQETIRRQTVHGATVERLPISDMADWEIALPPLSEQRAIAEVLGALDDKIEANRRTISTIWSLAEGYFLKIAEHEDVASVPLGHVARLSYGKSLPAGTREPGRVPVFGSGGILGHHKSAMVQGPGVVVGRKGTAGAVHWSDSDFFPIDTTFYVESDLPMEFVYFALRSLGLDQMNFDSAVPGLNRNAALARSIPLPNTGVLATFGVLSRSLTQAIAATERENDLLATLRDTLLPELLSGELRVQDAQSLVGKAV